MLIAICLLFTVGSAMLHIHVYVGRFELYMRNTKQMANSIIKLYGGFS